MKTKAKRTKAPDAKRRKELEAIVAKARNELWEYERAEKQAKARALVGRAFRYRNSYSGDDAWWLYAIVTGVSEHGYPLGFTFQRASDNKVSIDVDQVVMSIDSWTEVSVVDVRQAWRRLFDGIVTDSDAALSHLIR